eukprot:scaffold33786_cov32-Tisochrysis_lutea.AAC.1
MDERRATMRGSITADTNLGLPDRHHFLVHAPLRVECPVVDERQHVGKSGRVHARALSTFPPPRRQAPCARTRVGARHSPLARRDARSRAPKAHRRAGGARCARGAAASGECTWRRRPRARAAPPPRAAAVRPFEIRS